MEFTNSLPGLLSCMLNVGFFILLALEATFLWLCRAQVLALCLVNFPQGEMFPDSCPALSQGGPFLLTPPTSSVLSFCHVLREAPRGVLLSGHGSVVCASVSRCRFPCLLRSRLGEVMDAEIGFDRSLILFLTESCDWRWFLVVPLVGIQFPPSELL